MTWAAIGVGVVSAGAGLYAANKSAGAAKNAAKNSLRQDQATLQQQSNLSRQELDIQRPVIQTRDAAMNQLNAFFGLPQVKPTNFSGGGGTNGTQLIALPGVTTTGSHSATADKPATTGSALFYDPSSHTVVDGSGNLVSNIGQPGVIPGLVSGFNNPVSIDANGQLYGIGSKGVGALNIQPLVRAPAEAQGAAGGAAAPFDYNSVLTNPSFQIQQRQGQQVIDSNLASRGKFFSGQRGAALLNFQNDLTRSHINEDYLQPRLTLAGYGAAAATGAQNSLQGQSANIGNYATNYGAGQQGLANARESGYSGTANALIGGLGAGFAQYNRQQAQKNNNNLLNNLSNNNSGYATIQPVSRTGSSFYNQQGPVYNWDGSINTRGPG